MTTNHSGKPLEHLTPLFLLCSILTFACHFILEIPDESPAWSDGDGESDSDVDADGDVDGDGDIDDDYEFGCEVTGENICRIRPEMVRIPEGGFCIDRYEASRSVGDIARSIPGELPWVNISYEAAQQACSKTNKRLCKTTEWQTACQGPIKTTYPYSNDYSATACNGAENDAGMLETGSLDTCEGGFDCIFDMSGNVDEWVEGDCPGSSCQVLGGTYHAQQSNLRCNSLFSTSSDGDEDIGFRCCVYD
jgi:hypothetical protein